MKNVQRTRAWFGAAFAVLVGVGFGAVLRTYEWEGSVAWVSHSFDLSSRLERLAGLTKSAEATARQLADEYDPGAAMKLAGDIQQIQAVLSEIEVLTKDDTIQVSNQQIVRRWISVQSHLLEAGAAALPGSAERMRQALKDYDRSGAVAGIGHGMNLMLERERRLLDERMDRQRSLASGTRRLFEVACFLSLVLVLVAAWRSQLDHTRRTLAEQALKQ